MAAGELIISDGTYSVNLHPGASIRRQLDKNEGLVIKLSGRKSTPKARDFKRSRDIITIETDFINRASDYKKLFGMCKDFIQPLRNNVSAGSDVVIQIADTTGFSVGDSVIIQDLNHSETTTITGVVANTSIKADLTYSYTTSAGAIVASTTDSSYFSLTWGTEKFIVVVRRVMCTQDAGAAELRSIYLELEVVTRT